MYECVYTVRMLKANVDWGILCKAKTKRKGKGRPHYAIIYCTLSLDHVYDVW